MKYGRNIDDTLAQGSTEYHAIDLHAETTDPAEAVLADYDTTTGTVGTGTGLVVTLHYWDGRGDLRAVDEADSGNWTQVTSQTTTDDGPHTIGAVLPDEANVAILEINNSGDSGEIEVQGSFLHDENEDATVADANGNPKDAAPVELASNNNVDAQAYHDGAAQ